MNYKELKEHLKSLSYEQFLDLIYQPNKKEFYRTYRKALPRLIAEYYPKEVNKKAKEIETFINNKVKEKEEEQAKTINALTASGVDIPTRVVPEIRPYTILPFHGEEYLDLQRS